MSSEIKYNNKLLVITQKIDKNDPILGFFHNWVLKLSEKFEKVSVICLEKGECDLPQNVKVYSLGKEDKTELRIKNYELSKKIRYIKNFLNLILGLNKDYDAVFVHMNPIYVVLGGFFWKILRKKIYLWYVHKKVDLKLRIAETFSNVIFTSAPESFQLKSKKVEYVGHGINTDLFKFTPPDLSDEVSMIFVGRVTKIKSIEVALKASSGRPFYIVGEPMNSEDENYKKELDELGKNLNMEIHWVGAVKNHDLQKAYFKNSIGINALPDGGMDKSVLESWIMGHPTFTSNKAFQQAFGEYSDMFIFKYGDSVDLEQKINNFLNRKDKEEIITELSKRISFEYSINALVSKLHKTICDLN